MSNNANIKVILSSSRIGRIKFKFQTRTEYLADQHDAMGIGGIGLVRAFTVLGHQGVPRWYCRYLPEFDFFI